MAVKKQPESDARELSKDFLDWSRQFLKHFELNLVGMGQPDAVDSPAMANVLGAVRAFAETLRDAGLDDAEILEMFGRVAVEANAPTDLKWNADLNKRRFELIDRDIQGTLSPAEQLELAGLTQVMREHVDSETNLPAEGAKKLHWILSGFDSESQDSGQ